ncbi:hypothetical protein V6U90_26165 [Micromonospora sp. CPCC 206060]|uniref:hypothetical protein n=1 Tax=Micromonospora sp. CPCC 206060 TaxID=3122406 RepID=UPI002FF1C61E
MSRRERRRRRNQRHATQVTPVVSGRSPAPATRRPSAPFGVFLLVAVLGTIVLAVVLRDPLSGRIREIACVVTGCTGTGMATAGWLVISLWLFYAVGMLLAFPRLGIPARIVAVLVGCALTVPVLTFTPGKRGRSLANIVDGVGAEAFKTGVRWGFASVALALVAALLVSRERSRSVRQAFGAGLVVVFSLAMLGVAVVRAEPVRMTAAQTVPEPTFTAAGDTLRRGAARDLAGCAGVLPDDTLLDGCLRTVRASWTTDDSDAVVHLAAVFFPGYPRVHDALRRIPDGLGQTGVDGPVLTRVEGSAHWLLLTSVGHADRRPIAAADQGHLRWAVEQVTHRFIGTYLDQPYEPEPENGIGPRTP